MDDLYPTPAEPGIAISGKALLDELRKGGYIVYFRHTKTLPEHAHEAKMRRDGNLCCAPRAYWRGQGEPPVD